MKSIVPYSKEIKFDSKLAEICSISLEPEINITDTEIEGNFIVSGEYKTHPVSVNKEDFEYTLPFSVDVTENIVKDSIEVEVTDFTYEIIGDDSLKVDIEFAVTAEEAKQEVEENREEFVEDVNAMLEQTPEEELDLFEEELDPIKEMDEDNQQEIEEDATRLDQESAEMILDSASHKEDEFTTYNIHLVKPGDTLESIVATYQTDLMTLKQYNTIEELNIGDKIIIPSIDE